MQNIFTRLRKSRFIISDRNKFKTFKYLRKTKEESIFIELEIFELKEELNKVIQHLERLSTFLNPKAIDSQTNLKKVRKSAKEQKVIAFDIETIAIDKVGWFN